MEGERVPTVLPKILTSGLLSCGKIICVALTPPCCKEAQLVREVVTYREV